MAWISMNRRTRRLYPNARVNRITFLTFLIGKSRGNVQSCNKHADLFAAIRSLDPNKRNNEIIQRYPAVTRD